MTPYSLQRSSSFDRMGDSIQALEIGATWVYIQGIFFGSIGGW